MSRKPREIGFHRMVRDVLVVSMRKGQFPLAMVSAIFLAVIFRMPAADVSHLAFRILESLENGMLLGWVLMGLSQVGWLIHARHQRRRIVAELDRISQERNDWQSRALNQKLKSSEGRK